MFKIKCWLAELLRNIADRLCSQVIITSQWEENVTVANHTTITTSNTEYSENIDWHFVKG